VTKSTPRRDKIVVVANCVDISLVDGIVHVTYLDGAEISAEVKRQMFSAFKEVTNGIKHPFLFRSAGKLWVTREAREYAKQMEPDLPYTATALIAESLGFRLIAEFYGKIYKPAIPYKVFRNEEEAVKWLKSF
jgi:hypothetical protein